MKIWIKTGFALTCLTLSTYSFAACHVSVSNAWVRPPLPGQDTAAAFMDLKSPCDTALIKAQSPAATMQLHTTTVENGVAQTHPVQEMKLPAGQTVHLAPKGKHIMMSHLKQPVKVGGQVKLRLTFQNADHSRSVVNTTATVRQPPTASMDHMGH